MPVLDQASIEQFAVQYLVEAGTPPENAAPVARAVAQAEAEGNVVCGLFYLLQFKEQIGAKKVDALILETDQLHSQDGWWSETGCNDGAV